MATFSVAVVGAGVLMILAGRLGMNAKDATPAWRIGYTIWFIGGWLFIAFGIVFPLAVIALATLASKR
jgi:hypothetical protein